MSGQITVGRAGRHVRYSEVMSGLADTFRRGRTKQSGWVGGPNEPPSCQLSTADECRTAPRLLGMIIINKLLN